MYSKRSNPWLADMVPNKPGNLLTIIPNEPKEGEFSDDSHILPATKLGAPDWKVFKNNLYQMLINPKGLKYIFNLAHSNEPKEMVEAIKEASTRAILSLGSLGDSYKAIKNVFNNMDMILSRPDVSQVKLDTDTAIFVAAGPSYELTRDKLKEVQNYYLIVAADAIAPRMIKDGIMPDIITTSERVPITRQFIEALPNKDKLDTLLICATVTHPDTLDIWPGKLATGVKQSVEGCWITMALDRPVIETAPFVAPFTMGILGVMGVKHVCLLANDLAFSPGGRSHADLKMKSEKEVLNVPIERIKVPGITTPVVKTTNIWKHFGEQIGEAASRYKLSLTNCSPLGAIIPNTVFNYFDLWLANHASPTKPTVSCPDLNPHRRVALRKVKNLLKVSHEELRNMDTTTFGNHMVNTEVWGLMQSMLYRNLAVYESWKFGHPDREAEADKFILDKVKDVKSRLLTLFESLSLS